MDYRPDLTEFPATILARLIDIMEGDSAFMTDLGHPEINIFAGEFFDENEVEDLIQRVSQVPVLLVDMDDLFPTNPSDSSQTPEGTYSFSIFCCVSNRRDASGQMIHAATVANKVRRQIVGREFESQAGEHNNGFFTDQGIHRQFHTAGMSVYSFDTELDLTEQMN